MDTKLKNFLISQETFSYPQVFSLSKMESPDWITWRPCFQPTEALPSPRYAMAWRLMGNQVLAIGSGSSPTVSSHCWWLIPCYLARLGSMESADCPDAFLQWWCNHEGFNSHVAGNGFSRVQISVIGNEQDDCNSPDSRIGSGEEGSGYENVCGYGALWSADHRDKNIKEFGYIFIQ